MRLLTGSLFVFFSGVMAQWLWSTHGAVFGLSPQLLLALTVAVAAHAGPVPGQSYGFFWGLVMDALGTHVFGAHALGFSLVGYFVGIMRRQLDVTSIFPQVVLVLALTPAYCLLWGSAGRVFEHRFLWVGWTVFLLGPLYNSLVTPLAFVFVRRWVRAGEAGMY